MACKDKLHDNNIGDDDKNRKIVNKKLPSTKFYPKMKSWKKKRVELEKEISSPEHALRVFGKEPDDLVKWDPQVESVICVYAKKVVRTINHLCNKLVSVDKKNNHFQNQNEALVLEIDQLRAIIRISSGNSNEYRQRLSELNNLIVRIDKETRKLKIRNDKSSCDNSTLFQKQMKYVEMLMNKLMLKLKNDREAILASEKLRLPEYTEKISELAICSESLLRQLERTETELRARSCGIEWFDTTEYPEVIDGIEKLVKNVGSNLKCLKSVPMKTGTRVGGESCVHYLKRIRNLEKFVGSSLSIIDKLIIDSKEVSQEMKNEDLEHVRVFSNSRESVEALKDLAKKLKSGIKALELSVASGDSENLTQKIRELERSRGRLKNEISKKDEKNSWLSLELTGAKISYDEKSEALEKLQKKYERVTSKMKKRGIDLENDDKKMENLIRELEQSKLEVRDIKSLRDELNEIRPEMAKCREENAKLVKEINIMHAAIVEKDDRLANISEQNECIERELIKEVNETRANLVLAMEEMKSLKQDNVKLKSDLESQLNRMAAAEDESKESQRQLSLLLKDTSENLENEKLKVTILNNKFIQLTSEKSEIELELSRTKAQNEALQGHLDSERATVTDTLQNYDKLINDFKLLNRDFESLKIERSCIGKNLEDSNLAKAVAIAEIENLRKENSALRDESKSIKVQIDSLTLELKESNFRHLDINAQLKKLNEQHREQSIILDSIKKDNEDLNNKLDSARSDKLNIAGALNDSRLKYEDSSNQLNSKIREVSDLQDRLRVVSRDFEEARTKEKFAKLEAERLLDENESLRETIDVSNVDKTSFKERLESLDNEYRALKNQLSVSENENKTLKDDSIILKRQVDKLMEDLKQSTIDKESDTENSSNPIAEQEKTAETMQRKLGEFQVIHESLEIELTRLRDENFSLKSEHERITAESEKMRLRCGGKKTGELNRVLAENETMKLELTKLKIANTETDRLQLGLAKSEREKLCSEIFTLRKENCTMKMLLNKISVTNGKLEEQGNSLKIANDLLKRNLDDAKNELARDDKKVIESKATISILKDELEELKKRYSVSIKDAEELRSQNEKFNRESRDMKKSLESTKSEDRALRQEIDILRSALKRVNDDNSKRRMDFAETEEELVALKGELSRVREENDVLRAELDVKFSESCRIESEKATLKDELEELKRARILAVEEGNELRDEYEKLKVLKVTLESKLMDALKEIGKYAIASAKLNGLENKLKGVLKDYVVTKKLLRSANDEVNHLRRLAEPCIRSLEVR